MFYGIFNKKLLLIGYQNRTDSKRSHPGLKNLEEQEVFKQKSLFSQTKQPTWNANTCSRLVLGVWRHLLEDHGGMSVHEMA